MRLSVGTVTRGEGRMKGDGIEMEDRMQLDTLEYEESEGVAVVTLNRPEVHNAFNETMQRELQEMWQSLRTNDAVRCGGADGSRRPGLLHRESTGVRCRAPKSEYKFDPYTYEDPGRVIGPRSQGLWKPVIAAVNGMACGGAFYLLGESDFIIASETATFFDPHVTYGMPAVFEPNLMASRMPFGDLMRMTLMGTHERISARRAEMMGMVTQVVAPGDLLPVARGVAPRSPANPRPPCRPPCGRYGPPVTCRPGSSASWATSS